MVKHRTTVHETGNNIGNGIGKVRSQTSHIVISTSAESYFCGTVSHPDVQIRLFKGTKTRFWEFLATV